MKHSAPKGNSTSSRIEAMEARTLLSASFATPYDYSVGARPTDIVVADLNGDGQPDVATAGSAANSISVHFGTPGNTGTFGAVFHYPTSGGFGPERILAGNLDGDADIDLLAIDEYGSYAVYRTSPAANNFSTFTPLTAVALGLQSIEAELVDIDGDSYLDLVVLGQASNASLALGVRIYAGQNNGTFATTPTVIPINGNGTGGLAIADVDGNGAPDIVAGSSSEVTIVRNPLAEAAITTIAQASEPQSVTTGDFNEDGKPDLVVATADGGAGAEYRLVYLQNDGAGGFSTSANIAMPTVYTRTVKSADVDGDGNQDVLTIAGTFLGVLRGNGNGTFAGETTYSPGNAFPYAIDVGDFNGDGRPDVVLAAYDLDAYTVHLNSSTPGDGGGNTPAADLSVAFDAASSGSTLAGGAGDARVTVANGGEDDYDGDVVVKLFASLDGTLDGNDVELATVAKSAKVKAGRTKSFGLKFDYPASLPAGAYTLIAQVSGDASTANNTAAFGVTTTVSAASVELEPGTLTIPATVKVGKKGRASFTLTNTGNTELSGSPVIRLLLSTDASVSDDDIVSATTNKSLRLKPGKGKAIKLSFELPNSAAAGATLFSFVQIDFTNLIVETNEANNVLTGSFSVV